MTVPCDPQSIFLTLSLSAVKVSFDSERRSRSTQQLSEGLQLPFSDAL